MFRRRDRTAVQRPFIGSHEFGIAAIINNYACGIINRTKDTAVCGLKLRGFICLYINAAFVRLIEWVPYLRGSSPAVSD